MQSREGLVSRRFGNNSGFVCWKWIGLLTQTSELLGSSSLEGRANKSRGKVPVTSFLQPGGGQRRGRERFPGKRRERLERRLPVAWRNGARGGGLARDAGPGRPLPGISALRSRSRKVGPVPGQSSHLRGATLAQISAALPVFCTPTPSAPGPGPRRQAGTNPGSSPS